MKLLLTKRQEEILVGSILGDGCVYPIAVSAAKSKNCCYYFKQSWENKDYVFWLYQELKSICPSEPKQRKDNKQWYFYSYFSRDLVPWRRKFYPRDKKVVPQDIAVILTSSLSIAIWYMDDGTLDYRPNYHCSFSLSTHSFSLKDTWKLVDVLGRNFGIKASVSNNLIRGTRYPRIYIGKEGRDRFVQLISPHILDCFKYKLPQYRQPLRDFSRIKIGG